MPAHSIDLEQSVQISLKVAELVDLIEIGAIAEHESGWDFPILADLRALFTKIAGDQSAAADEI